MRWGRKLLQKIFWCQEGWRQLENTYKRRAFRILGEIDIVAKINQIGLGRQVTYTADDGQYMYEDSIKWGSRWEKKKRELPENMGGRCGRKGMTQTSAKQRSVEASRIGDPGSTSAVQLRIINNGQRLM